MSVFSVFFDARNPIGFSRFYINIITIITIAFLESFIVKMNRPFRFGEFNPANPGGTIILISCFQFNIHDITIHTNHLI